MASRNPLIIVSGLFQELDVSADKLNFGGNTTADLTENTNLYYSDTRARAAVSVTDSGGLGSLAYDNSTGVITYTGPSDADVTGLISVAAGSGLTYSSGAIDTSSIPIAKLASSAVTIGSTAVSLGATEGDIAGLTSLTATTLYSGGAGTANSISIASGNIVFEGATANDLETTLTAADPTTSSKTITLPDKTGTVALLTSLAATADSGLTYNSATGVFNLGSIPNSNLANNAVTIGTTAVSLGGTATDIAGLTSLTATTLNSGGAGTDNSISIASGNIVFENATAGDYEIKLTAADATAEDKTITLPNETGTLLTNNTSIAVSQLASSSVTIGSTAVSLGGTATTIDGLVSLTSQTLVSNSGFRIRDATTNTKQLGFDCSLIDADTTRTLKVPNNNGTIATESFATAIAVALG
tara:strand:- start:1116 stop:2357 length:1242 start_codon:yes stop_codon:yes gene_type:complete